MTDATYNPNADPNYGIAPYNSANTISLVLHTDPTTGALVFPTDIQTCLLYTSPSPRDRQKSRMPSSA